MSIEKTPHAVLCVLKRTTYLGDDVEERLAKACGEPARQHQ